MHLARRDVEVDVVKSDDLAKGLADPARANSRRFRRCGSPDRVCGIRTISACGINGRRSNLGY
jgi:hypothetical protein